MEPVRETMTSLLTDGRVFYIPFYQRSYVWESDLLERFLNDLQYITSTKEDYFFGSIILQKQTPNGEELEPFWVIDGQQRLTTLALFIKAYGLCNHNEMLFHKKFHLDSGKLTIHHSMLDRKDFERVDKQSAPDPLDGESKLIKAFNFFLEKIPSCCLDINTILAHAVFINVKLTENEDANKIFDTINSLGVKLTTGELLKNYLFKENTLEQYESIWKPVFEKDKECLDFWNSKYTYGRLETTVQEEFFYDLLQVFTFDGTYQLSADLKKQFRKSGHLFENYKHLLKISGSDYIQFARIIVEYAQYFRRIFDVSCTDKTDVVSTQFGRMQLIIFALESSTILPYILYVLKNVKEENEQEKMFRLLETYIIRRHICKSSSKNYSDLFTESLIGNQCDTYQKLMDYILDKENSLQLPSDEDIADSLLDNGKIDTGKARCILYLLEYHLRDNKKSATCLKPLKKYSLEHLMPQKWEKAWMPTPLPKDLDDFREQRNNAVKTLGNMAIIPGELNSAIQNSSWHTKKKGNSGLDGLEKFANGLETLSDVLSLDEWNEEAIFNRTKWLIEKIATVWPVDDTLLPQNEQSNKHLPKYFCKGMDTPLAMSSFVPQFVRLFMKKYPNMTFAELRNVFLDKCVGAAFRKPGFLCSHEKINQEIASDERAIERMRKRFRYDDESSWLTSSDGIEFVVNNQWTSKTFNNVLAIAKKYKIRVKKS